MVEPSRLRLSSAVEDFRHARRQASLQQIVARLTGKSAELLSYENVRQKLKAMELSGEELKEVPLDAIVGSVGRYTDFTRSFLPRQDSDEGRWARVKVAMTDMRGVPPIQVYQIGQAYFVQDGNHRVSIARRLGATHIEAYVTQVQTKVPLSPNVQPDDLILKAEYTDFLEHTRLNELRPEADLSVTAPGQYQVLEEHIEVHRYFMGLEQEREIPYAEAVAHWYDEVYLPVVQVIRERGILRDFPGRTETDLHLWISEHRATLVQELGWEIGPEVAAADLSAQLSPRPQRVAARVSSRILDVVTPDELEAGPPPGQWRKEHMTARQDDRLFADILVAVNGAESGWYALEYALEIARREGARLHGLHVAPSEAEEKSPEIQAIQAEFDRRCREAGIPGDMAFESGKVQRRVCDRAPLTDLVVLSLSYPPAPQPMARLGSGLRTIIQRCPRPVLTVPEGSPSLERVLLAYDGSPKADEALFIATYVADQWNIPLAIVTVVENGRTTSDTLERAQSYLETQGVQASVVKGNGPVTEAILKAAKEHASDLIIMGGYGFSPVLEVVLGSTVDQVLRASQRPVLICR